MRADAMQNSLDRFAGRTLGVATMHGKEQVIGPALMRVLPIDGAVAIPDVDTDRFGAFSGEVARDLDPVEACIAKARHGAEASGMDLVVASEGSFGPYPPAPFMPCDEEFLVLYDARDGMVFTHRHVSLETVFGGEEVRDEAGAMAFAQRFRFPEHALVARPREHWRPGDPVHKGITDPHRLRALVSTLVEAHGSCWLETDMRAMMNPTRMRVIGETAERFADELSRCCPVCGACWFRITGTRSGLPCALCGWPTESVRSMERGCWACGHVQFEGRPDGRVEEDPQHCAHCNP
ncbi:MAG: hypothetical protein QY325_03810 [Flavobacteriales bacterium]|nr:MAG: hypothetical protein QY325_03810 [Flavobacteriales bacterium]